MNDGPKPWETPIGYTQPPLPDQQAPQPRPNPQETPQETEDGRVIVPGVHNSTRGERPDYGATKPDLSKRTIEDRPYTPTRVFGVDDDDYNEDTYVPPTP